MKIVIAEDDELMLKTLEFRLKKDGHQVISTRNGREALNEIAKCNPDLVISDIMMPLISGLDIARTLKETYLNKIPIIILSGLGQENIVLEAFEMGVRDFMTKPFSPNELLSRVKRFVAAVQ